jgi:hypothetical protein
LSGGEEWVVLERKPPLGQNARRSVSLFYFILFFYCFSVTCLVGVIKLGDVCMKLFETFLKEMYFKLFE